MNGRNPPFIIATAIFLGLIKMRIDSLRPVGFATARSAKERDGADFKGLVSDSKQAPARLSAPTLLAPSLTLIGEEELPQRRRRREVTTGRRLLDDLDAVRRELVAGGMPLTRLRCLAAELTSTAVPLDPELSAIYEEIAVRVAVETAKLESWISA